MIAAVFVLMQLGVTVGSTWVAQPVGTDADLRIVRAVDGSVAWAAGENGVWARTADGGQTWYARPVYTCTSCPITGLVAHSPDSAVLATTGRPARIYLTGDGGRTWSVSWESGQHDVHLAALAFFDPHRGFAVSDPVAGRFLLLTTTDAGATWVEARKDALPPPLPNERIASASGTGAVAFGGASAVVATTGGSSARVFRTEDSGATWTAAPLSLPAVNALAFASATQGIAVGGSRGRANAARTTDGGRTWGEPFVAGLPGEKEGAAWVPGTSGKTVVVVGPSGSALSTDAGSTWQVVDRAAAHAVAFGGPVDAGWKVGEHGSIRKLMRGIAARRRAGEASPPSVAVAPPALGRADAPPTPTPTSTRHLKGSTTLNN